jgi:hypothetical protein
MQTSGLRRDAVALLLTCLLFAVSAAAQMSKGDALKAIRDFRKHADTLQKSAKAGNAAADAGRYKASLESLSRDLLAGIGTEGETLTLVVELLGVLDKAVPELESALTDGAAESRAALETALSAGRDTQKKLTELTLAKGVIQQQEGELNEAFSRDSMEKTDALLRLGQSARQRGDESTLRASMEGYVVNISVLGLAIQKGKVKKDEALMALGQVNKTRSHISRLEALLKGAPETAKPAIEKALLISKKGAQVASTALQRAQQSALGEGGVTVTGPASGNMPNQPGIPNLPN